LPEKYNYGEIVSRQKPCSFGWPRRVSKLNGRIRAQKMKILVIGSGGREHAITWALQRTSPIPLTIYCAPGNAGIGEAAQNVPLGIDDQAELARFADAEGVDLTIVGPEAPLAAGVVDYFMAKGLAIIGPSQAAARLEASKAFAKDFMARHGIPTAAYSIADSPSQAVKLIRSGQFGTAETPVIIKADGLAAGKGVVVAQSRLEAEKAVEDLMINQVAGVGAATRVIVEEALYGKEVSILIFTDGRHYALMPPARDHKRIGENDTGPNTGGMGSITDFSIMETTMLDRVVREIIEPTLAGARDEGFVFRGVLFFGLMLTAAGPQLLEYNVRFGDPETQAILVKLRTDLLSVFEATRRGTLGDIEVEWMDGSSACVVAANRGYPGKSETGAVIEGLGQIDPAKVQVFHAGTSRSLDGQVIATGGRVLGVTAAAADLPGALRLCYRAIDEIHWDGMQFRQDIGRSATT
jgi:phosphoribosylamine--glycine ligase